MMFWFFPTTLAVKKVVGVQGSQVMGDPCLASSLWTEMAPEKQQKINQAASAQGLKGPPPQIIAWEDLRLKADSVKEPKQYEMCCQDFGETNSLQDNWEQRPKQTHYFYKISLAPSWLSLK